MGRGEVDNYDTAAASFRYIDRMMRLVQVALESFKDHRTSMKAGNISVCGNANLCSPN
jgi:hypothetical protein